MDVKRTRKWAFVGQEAQRLADLGLTPLEIARRLDVRKSTVTRWLQAGKLMRPKTRPVRPGTADAAKVPSEWAQSVRATYALDSTDEQLVTCAESALALAQDMAETPQTRLAAMGRFQAIVKQLALVARLTDEEKPTQKLAPRPVVRRSGIDPRNVLQAVK